MINRDSLSTNWIRIRPEAIVESVTRVNHIDAPYRVGLSNKLSGRNARTASIIINQNNSSICRCIWNCIYIYMMSTTNSRMGLGRIPFGEASIKAKGANIVNIGQRHFSMQRRPRLTQVIACWRTFPIHKPATIMNFNFSTTNCKYALQ